MSDKQLRKAITKLAKENQPLRAVLVPCVQNCEQNGRLVGR